MSLKGVFTALSGALAQTQKIDTIANNIANVNTTGFKKDQKTLRSDHPKKHSPSLCHQVTASIQGDHLY